MKKLIFFFLLTTTFLGAENLHRVYPLKTYRGMYEALELIHMEKGKSLLSYNFPYNREEFVNVLFQIDPYTLSEAGQNAYAYIEDILCKDPYYTEGLMEFDWSAEVALETYLHTEKESLLWDYGFGERKPLLNMEMDLTLSDYFSVYGEMPLMKGRIVTEEDKNNWNNVPAIPGSMDLMFPYTAFLSGGGNHMNVTFGRDTLSWGSGREGNLLISEVPDFLDFVKFSTYWKNFKYSFHAFSFDSIDVDQKLAEQAWEEKERREKEEYERIKAAIEANKNGEPLPEPPVYTEADKQNFITDYVKYATEQSKILLTHGFEFRLWDKISFSVIEAVMFGKKNLDFRYFNPLLIYHNEYLPFEQNANVFIIGNLSITPVSGLNLYGQLAVDQYVTSYEASQWEQVDPSATGFIVGVEGLLPWNKGYFTGGAEYIHTDPYLGIDDSLMNYSTARRYVSQYRNDSEGLSTLKIDPLGMGPDKEVASGILGYRVPGRWSASLEYNWIRQGEITINDNVGDKDQEAINAKTPTGTPQLTHMVCLRGEYSFKYDLTAGAQIYFYDVENYSHIPENDFQDFQLILSLSWTL